MRRLFTGSLSLALALVIWTPWSPMMARGEIQQPKIEKENRMHRETDVLKILSVLEKRIGDQRPLEKAKGKLATLRRSELDLITSLSEQMTEEGERPGVDLAFLLITALIILA